MPWKASDAKRHTKQLKTPMQRAAWAKIANQELARSGDEASAIRIADSAAKRVGIKKK